ncbi:hypothetical protein HanXRQr2_Chr04g0186551 [Helianthus annuus]|uniref:Uncharacterized protein n=1 Tax=Helianthus annuus TaxID=4232 RepID=A0A9K3JB11_HELAN|nr:hypothetical protein HanXRQr2_Chr04g0186551 [Helianthus annuus]
MFCLVFFSQPVFHQSIHELPFIHLLSPNSHLKHKHRSYLIQDNYAVKWRIISYLNMLKGCPKDHPSTAKLKNPRYGYGKGMEKTYKKIKIY